jgi:hypothetical protein
VLLIFSPNEEYTGKLLPVNLSAPFRTFHVQFGGEKENFGAEANVCRGGARFIVDHTCAGKHREGRFFRIAVAAKD